METNERSEKINSVEISVNAKALFSGKVKIYESDINLAYTAALGKAEQLEKLIRQKNGLSE